MLARDVDGATVTAPGSYTVTSTSQAPFTVIDLQSAVGSPDPNQCSVEGLTMHTLLQLDAVDLDEAVPFQIGDVAVASTAAPGAIRQDEGTTSGARTRRSAPMPGGTLKNTSTGTCLTAPSVKNGTPLTVTACGGAARQQWELPALTPAPVSPGAALGAPFNRK